MNLSRRMFTETKDASGWHLAAIASDLARSVDRDADPQTAPWHYTTSYYEVPLITMSIISPDAPDDINTASYFLSLVDTDINREGKKQIVSWTYRLSSEDIHIGWAPRRVVVHNDDYLPV